MKRIYLVLIDSKVSQVAYETLEEAQEFIKSRLRSDELDKLEGMQPYYNVFSLNDCLRYSITDVMVEM